MTPEQARQIRAGIAAVALGVALVLIGTTARLPVAGAEFLVAAAIVTARPSRARP